MSNPLLKELIKLKLKVRLSLPKLEYDIKELIRCYIAEMDIGTELSENEKMALLMHNNPDLRKLDSIKTYLTGAIDCL